MWMDLTINDRKCTIRTIGRTGMSKGIVYPKASDEIIYPLCVFQTIVDGENWAISELSKIANKEVLTAGRN